MRLEVGFPFQIDDRGRVADPTYSAHVEQLIEQLLFTERGDRVNRPDLGAGLLELIFAPASAEIVAVAQSQVAAALNRWLGEKIQVESVQVVVSEGNRLTVTVQYVLRLNQQRQVAVFEHQVAS
ncbi:MAG TPA: GPW/gp25 family protein [Thermoanaerobaculia bacterium]|nr:GPW/gp25 family protein [Thermoanaerobaculia bacterium]